MQRHGLALLASTALVLAPLRSQDNAPASAVWTQSELQQLAREIQAQVEDLRGVKFRQPVSVEVADKPTLVEYMKRRTEQTEPPEKLAADETIAKLLGVIDPGIDLMATAFELLEEQVGGFYDPPSKTFYLMDSMPKSIAGPILAHELVHALDDQLFDLDGTIKELAGESDAALAYHCVVEGSGTAGGTRWTMAHMGEFDMSGFQELMDEQQESMGKAPEWLWKPLLGSYLQGAAFLSRTDSVMGGQTSPAESADIEHAFRQRPRSTEQVLHPEKYWDPASRDEPRRVAIALDELPSGWELRRQDTLGEMALAIVTTPPGLRGRTDFSNPMSIIGVRYTNEPAAGWDGDRVVLLGKGDASWLRLVTVWDSERDAAEFYGAVSALLPALEDAAAVLGERVEGRTRSGAELVYGEQRDQVVLTVWSGVERRDLRRLEPSVRASIGEDVGAGD